MNSEAIKVWLKRKKSSDSIGRGLLSVAALFSGLVVLFLTFWFTYAIIWFGWRGVSAISDLAFGKRLYLTHEWRLLVSVVFLVLLFIQHFRTSPEYWGDYPDRDYVAHPALPVQAGVLGALGVMLAYPGASANMIADILLSGPRLVTGAWKLWRESRRLARLDESGCAELLTFLVARPVAVPYEELRNAGWEEWFGQLRGIEGVVFLEKGLGLSGELKQELLRLQLN